MKTLKRILSYFLIIAVMCSFGIVTVFATDSSYNSRTINGSSLACTISYDAAENQYSGGELDLYSTWNGSVPTRMVLTSETVDYYTGQSVSFGNGTNTTYSSYNVRLFWWTPVYSSKISVFSCTDLYLGTTGYSLYSSLTGADGV